MLKKRIIPLMLLLDDRLVKTTQFDTWRDVGDPVKSASVYNSQYTDELVLLNIARENRSVEQLATLIPEIAKVSFMPLAVGGGINSFDDAAYLINQGADKIIVNSAAYSTPELITQIANKFGSQAVITSIDVKQQGNEHTLYSHCGQEAESIRLSEHINRCQQAGTGEFMIQSIEHDGMMAGFNIPLLTQVMALSKVPVIGCSGSGDYQHLKQAFVETNVSALGCGSLFNFSDSNPIRAKNYLTNYNLAFKQV
ncbi:imidazole glycerol phosphate synthase subunit HisF [Thalassotalea euphylliae]|uniref:imidazole glycerol-phosphate synthase n=1 Tax=Thalassotalea euphylliae TaxID=1655234 RepID=A0A3E0UGD2_9GAMM|nr:imidazole glycerol phosphate synthase cyclase subunit [Thalassotalea euphylliae]REL34812.1 imidazole glycerol phosphate synthase cyclase subunit [Thalassotalea euphylliae]